MNFEEQLDLCSRDPIMFNDRIQIQQDLLMKKYPNGSMAPECIMAMTRLLQDFTVYKYWANKKISKLYTDILNLNEKLIGGGN